MEGYFASVWITWWSSSQHGLTKEHLKPIFIILGYEAWKILVRLLDV
jgi:hypothetical protein